MKRPASSRRFLGADANDIAFVENATTACNAVLRSLTLRRNDEIVVLTHGYGAVRNAVRFVTTRAGAWVVEAAVPFPRPEPERVVASVVAVLGPRTRLAVIDHITSPSALVLPVAAIVATCHAAGVPVLIDGAHGPGQIPLDLRTIGADWYVGNCHKWLCAPKGCGFLWATRQRQHDLHPVTISHGFGKGFREEFDWTGTRDPSAFLAVTAALDFHRRLGGPELLARNTALTAEATSLLARKFGTELGAAPGMAAAMGLVRLPLSGAVGAKQIADLRERLLDARTDAPVHALDGAAWLRVSAHAYNCIEDYSRLGEIVAACL